MNVNKYDRIIVLIDMDCFYCQVEEKLDPTLKGKPMAVVQYNAWQGGGIIAVNYPARDQGVTRHMRGDEAKEHCPEIELVRVPNIREKADLSKYRDAGKEVAAVLQSFTPLLERASVDEAYLDITQNVNEKLLEMNKGTFMLKPDKLNNTFAVGFDNISEFVQNISVKMKDDNDNDEPYEDNIFGSSKNEIKLLVGAAIVNNIRAAVKEKTGFECSAGIAHNKILAKLVCGLNKPNKQTILPIKRVNFLFSSMPVKKIKGLGGKFGDSVCSMLNVKMMYELQQFTQEELQAKFDEKNGLWLYLISRGIDLESVTPRYASKSIGCCKKFPGRQSLKSTTTVEHWLTELGKEILDRLEQDEVENNRKPHQMVVSYVQEINDSDVSSSRSVAMPENDELASCALDVIRRNTVAFVRSEASVLLNNPIKFLGISVGKFEDIQSKPKQTIDSMFSNQKRKIQETLAIDSPPNEIKSEIQENSPIESEEVEENKQITEQTNKRNRSSDEEDAAEDVDLSSASTNNIPINTVEPPKPYSFFAELKRKSAEKASLAVGAHEASTSFAAQSTSSASLQQNDYTSTYAEFYQPPLELPPISEICPECNKKVKVSEMQSHADAHFAFKLSQEQREEFRSQWKQNKASNATPPPVKKQKTVNLTKNNSTESKHILLNTFFKTSQPEVAATTSTDVQEGNASSELCKDCGKMILIKDLPEHSDYHMAKKIHQQWNNQNSSVVKPVSSNKQNKSSKTSSVKNNKTVLSYFKLPN